MPSVYKVRPEDSIYAEEFRQNPIGHHSPGLNRILTLFRGEPVEGKHVLICKMPHREWLLGQLSGERGKPVTVIRDEVIRSQSAAEWEVFKRRWKRHTGEDLEGTNKRREIRRPYRDSENGIAGYSDVIYVRPGETIDFKVSCEGVRTYQSDIVRLICGDTDPEGPGFKDKLVKTHVSGRRQGRKQEIRQGSHAVVPTAPALESLESFSVQAMVWPTTPGKGLQGVLSKWSAKSKSGFALVIDTNGRIALTLGDGTGRVQTVTTGRSLLACQWYFVGASYDSRSGKIRVFQKPLAEYPGIHDSVTRSARLTLRRVGINDRPVVMAGLEDRVGRTRRTIVVNHYNGKIDSPRLANRALSEADMDALRYGVPASLEDAIVAAWDFSRDIGSERITDLSSNQHHGTVINLPTRAMTGWNWTGQHMRWSEAPEQWGAIHFHDDDLYDAGWETDFEWKIPGRLKSGLYAARFRSGRYEEYIPFAVGPRPGRESKVALLLPTASYMAYANERSGTDSPDIEPMNGLVSALYPQDLFLNEHREYGASLYDTHSDGSGVAYSSRLRPIVNMRPKYESNMGGTKVHQFNADTHIIDWLEANNIEYDVITDEELDRRGLTLLSPYRVVLTGSHPEYWSSRMWDGMVAYQRRGGRLMYLGGNGFYWKIAFHPELPGVIEVRRNETGMRAWPSAPGDYYHSFDGEYGGLWLNQGRGSTQQSIVGVGFCAQGFDLSSYYRRKPDSFDDKVKFVFDGIGDDELIGDFGLLGSGAAGWEIDRVSFERGTPPNAYILASSENHSDVLQLVPEDLLEGSAGTGGQEHPGVRADMVFFETPNDGAVFSVSSIAWAGSLSHNGCNNNVSRITKNVLNRFLVPEPF